GRVDDDPAVGLGCDAEGETARDVGLDDTGDDVHGGPLRGDHEVDPHRTGHLGDADDGLLDFAARHHHQVVELVDHHHDVREAVEALGVETALVQLLPVALDVPDLRLV